MRNWIKNPVQNSAELYKVLVQFDSIQSSKTWYLVVHTPVASRFRDRNLKFLKNFRASRTFNPVSSLLSINKNVRVFFSYLFFFQYVPDVFRICIRSNLRVAQNERFVISQVYPGSCTIVPKILDFGLSENLKIQSPRAFTLSKYI